MAKKDRGKDPTEVYNPYFGKATDESRMAKKPFWTWIVAIPFAIGGAFIGPQTVGILLGALCGAAFGIAIGSLIDKAIEGRRENREQEK